MPDKKRPLKFHPLANLFPLIEGEEYEGLKDGIAANAHPIVIYLLEGKILDGRNRYRACRELGIEPEFRQFDGPGSPLEFVVTMNMNRRHLTSSQRAALAVGIEEIVAKEAKQRRRAPSGGGRKQAKKPEIFPESSEGEARERAAQMAGTNAHYVSDAKKIKKEDPELFQALRNGTKTLPQVKRMRAAARKVESAAAEPADSAATDDGSPTDGAPDHTQDGHGTTPPDDAGTDGTADPTTDGHGTTPPDDDPVPTADDALGAHEGVVLFSVHDLRNLLERVVSLAPLLIELTLPVLEKRSSPHRTAIIQALKKLSKEERSRYTGYLAHLLWGAEQLRKVLTP